MWSAVQVADHVGVGRRPVAAPRAGDRRHGSPKPHDGPALLKVVVAEKYLAPRGPKTESKRVEVVETIPRECFLKPMEVFEEVVEPPCLRSRKKSSRWLR